MTTTPLRTAARAAVSLLALTALAALAGCAPLLDTLRNEDASTYSSSAELVERWEKTADWLPSDATEISIRETPDADPTVLLATSATPLDPALCVEVERRSAPVFAVEGSPDPFADMVFACGDWAVIPTDDGWFGWAPNHPDEQAASKRIG